MKPNQVPDTYTWTNARKILTREQMKIDGLEMFGHGQSRKLTEPLSYHSHPTMELVYMVSGSQIYYIGEQEYTVRGNQIFWTPADSEHGTGSSPHGRYEFFWFRLEEEPGRCFLNLDAKAGELLRQSLLQLPSHLIAPDRNLKELIARSFELLSHEDELSRIEGCAMLVQFLCEITNSRTGSGTVSEEIAAAMAYIDTHIGEQITLEEVAAVSMLSVSRFKARFRQEVQVAPREYINLKKIEKAKELLCHTDHTITEIAFELAFSSSNYFAVLFRQIVGTAPSIYRQQKKEPERINK